MSITQIGTLIRCHDINERRIAFYQEIGLNCIQIAGVYEDWLAPTPEARKASDDFFALFRNYNIAVPTMFFSYPNQFNGEFGLVPEASRAERMLLSCRLLNWGKRYGIKYFACHIGFLPEERGEFYQKFIADLKLLAKFAADNDQVFMFETGTENVADLKKMIEDINEPNVGINFDPANLLYYGKDDPAKMVDELLPYFRVIHCKDANPAAPGEQYGKETVLGKGSTNFCVLLKRIQKGGFSGPLIIERELPFGPEQEKDIAEAVKLIKSTLEGE